MLLNRTYHLHLALPKKGWLVVERPKTIKTLSFGQPGRHSPPSWPTCNIKYCHSKS